MAMNKKEKDRLAFLEMMLSLHPTEQFLPDVPIPESDDVSVAGYIFNHYSKKIYKSRSSRNLHTYNGRDHRGGVDQYSTAELALRAMRREIEIDCASKLRAIDLMIEAEL